MDSKKVFISYSHDSPEHAARVAGLAASLRRDGVDCRIDQYVEGSPEEGWRTWMKRTLQWADTVLVVCTKTYLRRLLKEEKPGKGYGATYEANLIGQELYEGHLVNERFIPVVFERGHRQYIPQELRDFTSYLLDAQKGYDDLYVTLTGQHKPPRDLGDVKRLQREQAEPSFNEPGHSDATDDGAGGGTSVAVSRQTSEIELIIDKPFEQYSDSDQKKLLSGIAALLGVSEAEIKIKLRKRGSVILQLELDAEEADRLFWLVKRGALRTHGVTDARLIRPAKPTVEEPPSKLEEHQVRPSGRRREFKFDDWVDIPNGKFWMGAQHEDPSKRNYDPLADDDEAPVHLVTISAFRIGRYPVTVAEYRRFVDHAGYRNKVHWKAGGFGDRERPDSWEKQLKNPDWPVVGVTWYEASAYACWTGGRLPTEAEWEFAARGEQSRRYPWGDEEPTPQHLNYLESRMGSPTPVGIYPRGATPEGICDMAGNVWEWVLDRYGPYPKEARKNSKNDPAEPGGLRVFRGGSFGNPADGARASDRGGWDPWNRLVILGFRVVLPAAPQPSKLDH